MIYKNGKKVLAVYKNGKKVLKMYKGGKLVYTAETQE